MARPAGIALSGSASDTCAVGGHQSVPVGGEDFASVLSRFACPLSLQDLAAPVIDAVKVNVFDTLACAAAGSSAPAVAETRELAAQWGGAPQATILVFGDKVPAHHAAWVNGTMAHARDYDDTHDAAVLHAGVSVVPAALAAAQLRGGARGADFVAGIAAGLETICRLGVATRIGIIESGFIYTPLFGHFAATVAAGRVLGLDAPKMVNALGIVYSLVAGNHQVTRDGALTKRMQPGFAAQSALISVQLAQRNISGAQATFEGADGFLRVYLRDRCDRDVLRDRLGERYEFTQLSYKPYPCCRFNHTAIDAALALRASRYPRRARAAHSGWAEPAGIRSRLHAGRRAQGPAHRRPRAVQHSLHRRGCLGRRLRKARAISAKRRSIVRTSLRSRNGSTHSWTLISSANGAATSPRRICTSR